MLKIVCFYRLVQVLIVNDLCAGMFRPSRNRVGPTCHDFLLEVERIGDCEVSGIAPKSARFRKRPLHWKPTLEVGAWKLLPFSRFCRRFEPELTGWGAELPILLYYHNAVDSQLGNAQPRDALLRGSGGLLWHFGGDVFVGFLV